MQRGRKGRGSSIPELVLVIALALGCAVAGLTGCSDKETVGGCYGQVLDASTLLPIANCSVTVAGKSICTDASGAYAFSNIRTGAYSLVASACGYEQKSTPVTIAGYERNPTASKALQGANQVPQVRLVHASYIQLFGLMIGDAIEAARRDGAALGAVTAQLVSAHTVTSDLDSSTVGTDIATLLYDIRIQPCPEHEYDSAEERTADLIEKTLQLVKEGKSETDAVLEVVRQCNCGRAPCGQ